MVVVWIYKTIHEYKHPEYDSLPCVAIASNGIIILFDGNRNSCQYQLK